MKNPDINNTYSNTYKYDDVHSYEAYKDLLLNDGKSIHDKNYDITYYYDRRDEEKEDPEDDEMNWDK